MANRNGWAADSFDSAYLNSVLSDDTVIYLEQPPDFSSDNPRKYVLRLHKALYGLKQGARNWYESLKGIRAIGIQTYGIRPWGLRKEVGGQMICGGRHAYG